MSGILQTTTRVVGHLANGTPLTVTVTTAEKQAWLKSLGGAK